MMAFQAENHRVGTAGAEAGKRKQRLTVLGICVLLTLVCFLPLFPWVKLVNEGALFDAMKLSATVTKKLDHSYSIFAFLSFVQISKQGILGLWSSVLQIFFAILISNVANKRLRKTSQTMIFMPYFVSYVILRVLVFNMFEYEVGLVNNFVTSLGMERIDFYNTPGYDYWFSDDFVEDMKLMKKWADIGFWSKSALSDTNDSEAYENGLSIAEVAGMNPNKQISSANNFAKEHPDWKSAYITYGEVTGVMYPGHATQNGTAIVRGTKYPERCAMVLNFLMTDQAMNNLVQYGIEGVHYEVVDGVYKNLNEDFQYENFNTWNLRVNDYKLPQESDVDLQAMFDRYNEIGQKSKFPNVNIYGGFTEQWLAYCEEYGYQ